MTASEKNKCRHCGAVIPPTSTEQLCPACLMAGALIPPGDETLSLTSGQSLLLYGPAEFPCRFGDYQLLGLLGRGGMGTVYEAEHITTGRRVALKMLAQQLDLPDMRKRFLREGRLAAEVNHPNSLYIFGSEEIEDLPVITMEIAGSGTLRDKLRKQGPLPVTEAVDAILDVISGLESAFAAGVLHRDIKPSNCFVYPDGSVKVGDFGLSVSTLAKTDTFVTAGGKIMGTPAYASPEQLRGDTLDVRADIYSVGATLYTLLTNRAPFEGDNAVQVVANAVNQKPKPLTELRKDSPPGLARIVSRCLAKEPEGRFPDYPSLRNALLPFSSRVPEPASIKVRVAAGWIDYLLAFLVPYVILMLTAGAEKLIIQPLAQRTLYSMRYYFLLLGCGFLYFSITEGFWGAGLGKYLKGLRVIRTNGRPPGFVRALIRIFIPILCVEGVRMPLMLALIKGPDWTGFQTTMFVLAAIACAWIPVVPALLVRRENGFAAIWDLASGTRVIIRPRGAVRPTIETEARPEVPGKDADTIGPYKIIKELAAGNWIVAVDPVLRRTIWLIPRDSAELPLSRQNLARPGRLRWLQKVETSKRIWDAFEAVEGRPFPDLIAGRKPLPWSNLRHWLHDIATELWEAAADDTLPAELSLDHIWITKQGRAVLLDQPWPNVKTKAESMAVGDIAGQQRFLSAAAACVDSTSLPLHARNVLQNLQDGTFEKLSFLTGTLRGLLEKPADVSRGIRAACIFLLPTYVWIAVFIGYYQGERVAEWKDSLGALAMISATAVLVFFALIQLLQLPFGSTASQSTFRLAIINAGGRRAGISTLFVRWAIVWLPFLAVMLPAAFLIYKDRHTAAFIWAAVWFMLWISAAVYAVLYPSRGLHDRLAGTWVVRR